MKCYLIAINSKYIHPAMGMYQLITNTYHEVEFKEFTIKDDVNKIIAFINNSESKYVAFSVYIWNIEIIKTIIPLINKIVILGGPEASFRADLLNDKVQYIITGEGEEAFNELGDYLDNKITVDKVSNLYYLNDNNLVYTYTKLPNLNKVKHDLSLIKDYENRICYLESSRGCYFNCSYCLASTEKPVRFFPLEEVKSNILFLLNNHARIIKFLDRSFNIRMDYTFEIINFIKEHDNGYTTFQFEVIGDTFTDETINLINSLRPKMIRFEIGIQTTNIEVTKAIHRKQDFNKLRENVNRIKDNVVIHTDLIAGLPLETFESFKNSFNETFLLFTEELQLGFLKELQGTYISRTKKEHDYVFMNTSPYEVISNKYITKEELDEIRFVESGVDKLYNTNLFPSVMRFLFLENSFDPFETLLYIVKEISSIKSLRDYQLPELTKAFYLALCKLCINTIISTDYLLYIVKKDYLYQAKIKPMIWWDSNITRPERKAAYVLFSKSFNLDINDLYGSGHLEKYQSDNKTIYFLIVYKTHKKYELTY